MTHRTKIKIPQTIIKVRDENNDNSVDYHVVNGKLSTIKSKEKAKSLGVTFINKENTLKEILVNTDDLLELNSHI